MNEKRTEVYATETHEDGSAWRYERVITTRSDIRETPFGPADFGFTMFGPLRRIRIAPASQTPA